jgi:hypothetical protein
MKHSNNFLRSSHDIDTREKKKAGFEGTWFVAFVLPDIDKTKVTAKKNARTSNVYPYHLALLRSKANKHSEASIIALLQCIKRAFRESSSSIAHACGRNACVTSRTKTQKRPFG